MRSRRLLACACALAVLAACSSGPAVTDTSGSAGSVTTGTGSSITSTSSTTSTTSTGGGAGGSGGSMPDAGMDADAAAPPSDTLDSNRDRLLGTYFSFLKTSVTQPQSNGLSGGDVSSVCDVWSKLDPSARAVFLTLTARLQGSLLGSDGSSMLWHVTKLYRISGGQNATATDPGSCGGGEYNRMIMSMDAALQAASLAANQHQGAKQSNGRPDIADIPQGGFWRDSHDLGGPHAPFDTSDETNDGAPRGQTQFFASPTSAAATSPLGRMDLMSLVDPYALEMDQDYDCVHNSNPLCSYFTYGPACAFMTNAQGTDIYAKTYGDFEPGWHPTGCP